MTFACGDTNFLLQLEHDFAVFNSSACLKFAWRFVTNVSGLDLFLWHAGCQ